MKFYTNVQMVGNDFLVRGYENGERVKYRDKFRPTFYVPSKERTPFRTLDGKYVQEIKPGNVSDCKEFIAKYSGVEGFEVFGNDRYVYQYISDKYPQEHIEFDTSKINLVTIDIEVSSEYGFPLSLIHISEPTRPY